MSVSDVLHVHLVSGGCGSGGSIDVGGWGDEIKPAKWGNRIFQLYGLSAKLQNDPEG